MTSGQKPIQRRYRTISGSAIRENTLVLSNQFAIRVSRSLEQILPLGAIGELFSSYLKINEYQWIYDLQASELDMDAEADSDAENDQQEETE